MNRCESTKKDSWVMLELNEHICMFEVKYERKD